MILKQLWERCIKKNLHSISRIKLSPSNPILLQPTLTPQTAVQFITVLSGRTIIGSGVTGFKGLLGCTMQHSKKLITAISSAVKTASNFNKLHLGTIVQTGTNTVHAAHKRHWIQNRVSLRNYTSNCYQYNFTSSVFDQSLIVYSMGNSSSTTAHFIFREVQ